MYNRYIPQPDGSYRRSRVESQRPPAREACPPPPPKHPPCPQENCVPEQKPCPPPPKPCQEEPKCQSGSAAGFLQNLLPQNFDTGDLIVILLLLLLAGDCEENRSTALLTLVLYLFM